MAKHHEEKEHKMKHHKEHEHHEKKSHHKADGKTALKAKMASHKGK